MIQHIWLSDDFWLNRVHHMQKLARTTFVSRYIVRHPDIKTSCIGSMKSPCAVCMAVPHSIQGLKRVVFCVEGFWSKGIQEPKRPNFHALFSLTFVQTHGYAVLAPILFWSADTLLLYNIIVFFYFRHIRYIIAI